MPASIEISSAPDQRPGIKKDVVIAGERVIRTVDVVHYPVFHGFRCARVHGWAGTHGSTSNLLNQGRFSAAGEAPGYPSLKSLGRRNLPGGGERILLTERQLESRFLADAALRCSL